MTTLRLPLHHLAFAGVLSLALAACFGLGDGTFAELEGAQHGTVEYEADIAPIMRRYCTNCHATDAPALARTEPDLDTRELTEQQHIVCRVYITAVVDLSMPTGALERLTSEERFLVEEWAKAFYGGEVPQCEEIDD